MADIVKHPNIESIAEEAARRWIEIAGQAVDERGMFRIALSGGSTPKILYHLMASEPWCDQAPWAQTHIFWGDERRVPPSHPDSNYRMAFEALLDQVPVPSNQIYRMPDGGLAKSDARDYTNILSRHFDLGRREWPRFDLVLLGMGTDGHTASIFPGTRAVSDLDSMVIVYTVPQLKVERITLSLPVINHAHHILFMVAGEDKADTLAAVLEGDFQPSKYPSQAVKPVDGTLTWLVDKAAAAKLST